MEGFEHLVKVAMESEDDLICDGPMKFAVQRPTRKKSHAEKQTHGYEVDVVGARKDLLVLSSVKSFFGSQGVGVQGFVGLANEERKTNYKAYGLFNYEDIRSGVIAQACQRFGYRPEDVELRLYVGKFKSRSAQSAITEHLAKMVVGRGPVKVFGLSEIVEAVVKVAGSKTYINDPVIVTVKSIMAHLRGLKKK